MKKLTRREWFRSSGKVVLAAAVAPAVLSNIAEAATSKASQASVQYVTHPNGKKMCSNCKFFVAGAKPNEDGTCKVVSGKISPHGYCAVYMPKK